MTPANPDGLNYLENATDEEIRATIDAAIAEIRVSLERAAAAGYELQAVVYALLYRDGGPLTKTDLIGAGDVVEGLEELAAALAGEYDGPDV
jgi:hypothetical protein